MTQIRRFVLEPNEGTVRRFKQLKKAGFIPPVVVERSDCSDGGWFLSISGDREAVVMAVNEMGSTAGSVWETDPHDGFAYCLVPSWVELDEITDELDADGIDAMVLA